MDVVLLCYAANIEELLLKYMNKIVTQHTMKQASRRCVCMLVDCGMVKVMSWKISVAQVYSSHHTIWIITDTDLLIDKF